MDIYLMIATIIVSLTLIGIVLIQGQNTGLGSAFGGSSNIYRTRRGVEKTIFNITVVLATIFLILSLVTVMVQ